jgi:hypothetical protein
MHALLRDLLHIGVIQFGQFERTDRPGSFSPVVVEIGLLASYPPVLSALADALLPQIATQPLTHLLALPPVIPLSTAIALRTGQPLLYPSAADPDFVEGAYDYSVPTLLLTGVLTDGIVERALIKRVKNVGLEVKVIVPVLDLYNNLNIDGVAIFPWQTGQDLIPLAATPSFKETLERGLREREL